MSFVSLLSGWQYYIFLEMENTVDLLTALVGSRAHGLHTENSDYDWRGVFIVQTTDLLQLGTTPKQNKWIEGKNKEDDDSTSFELGKFLHMSTQGNPNILEIFGSKEFLNKTGDGERLLELWPYIWNSKRVRDAFKGYSFNQRKKYFDPSNKKFRCKFATAYLRSLYLGRKILETGEIDLYIKDPFIRNYLFSVKTNEFDTGNIVNKAERWESDLEDAYKKNPDKETDFEKINEFLLDMRKKYWVI